MSGKLTQSHEDQVAREAIEKLTKRIDDEEDAFSEEEVAVLKKMVDVWEGLETFGKIAGLLKTILMYVGWLAAAYLALRVGAADFIKHTIVGGSK